MLVNASTNFKIYAYDTTQFRLRLLGRVSLSDKQNQLQENVATERFHFPASSYQVEGSPRLISDMRHKADRESTVDVESFLEADFLAAEDNEAAEDEGGALGGFQKCRRERKSRILKYYHRILANLVHNFIISASLLKSREER